MQDNTLIKISGIEFKATKIYTQLLTPKQMVKSIRSENNNQNGVTSQKIGGNATF